MKFIRGYKICMSLVIKVVFFPDIYFDVNYSVLSVSDILMWH